MRKLGLISLLLLGSCSSIQNIIRLEGGSCEVAVYKNKLIYDDDYCLIKERYKTPEQKEELINWFKDICREKQSTFDRRSR